MKWIVLFAILLAASPTLAQSAEVDNWCRAGFFTRESNDFRIGIVTGKRRNPVYFYSDLEEDCPGDESCKTKAYVVPGDRVVVSRAYKDFGCAWFAPVTGMPTVGWIKLESLRFADTTSTAPLSAWLGAWHYAENSIQFTNNKLAGFLNVTGDALWRGVGGNAHVGELDERVEPRNNLIKVGEHETDEHACKVQMLLLGEFLVVADNMRCGGANVTFSGVYRKKVR